MGTSRRLHWIQPSVRRAAFAAAAAVLLVGAGITVSQSLDAENRRTVAASDLRQIGEAMQMYRSDFGGTATNHRIAAMVWSADSKKVAADSEGDGIADSKHSIRRGAIVTEGLKTPTAYGPVSDPKKPAEQTVTGLDEASRQVVARQGEIRYQSRATLIRAATRSPTGIGRKRRSPLIVLVWRPTLIRRFSRLKTCGGSPARPIRPNLI